MSKTRKPTQTNTWTTYQNMTQVNTNKKKGCPKSTKTKWQPRKK